MALNVTRFIATRWQDRTEYRSRITGQHYFVVDEDDGVMLYRGNRLLNSFPMPRSEALCLIELDSVSSRAIAA